MKLDYSKSYKNIRLYYLVLVPVMIVYLYFHVGCNTVALCDVG